MITLRIVLPNVYHPIHAIISLVRGPTKRERRIQPHSIEPYSRGPSKRYYSKVFLTPIDDAPSRIDDLDTKVAAIRGDLSVVHNQLSTAAQNQHQLLLDLQSLQNHTTSQFAVLSSNGVAAMESQHSLSTSMLDLRSQFSQMSRLMQELSNKLEINVTSRAAEFPIPQGHRSEEHQSRQSQEAQSSTSQVFGTSDEGMATEGSDGTEASVSSRRSVSSETASQASSRISHQDSSTESSSSSIGDEFSVAESSQCHSPNKKKHRSSPVTEETTAEQEEENSVDEEAGAILQTTRRYSMVGTNLGTRFDSVIEQETSIPRRPLPSSEFTSISPTRDTVRYTQEAPLDPQYKETGPDGEENT
jgi:hypothetical protein